MFLREKRLEKGLKQCEIARNVGISDICYRKYEQGDKDILNAHAQTFIKISEMLDVAPTTLYRETLKERQET